MPVDVIRARMLEALHDQGFTDVVPAHLVVLRYPGPDGLRPVEIAAQLGMSKQALNYLLGQLETLGYLERVEDRDDRRSKRVRLAERGYAAARVMRAAVAEVEEEFAQAFGSADLETLRALLTRLNAVLGSGQGPDFWAADGGQNGGSASERVPGAKRSASSSS